MLSSNPAAGRWSGLVRMTCILRVSSCRNRTWLMIITRRTLSHTHAYIQVGSLLASGIKASQTSCSWMFWEHGFAKGHALTLCLEQCSLSLSFSLCLSLALYLIIVVPCSHLWLFCLPNLQLRTRIAAIKALCDQQKGWVRWLGPGIVIHIYIWIIWDGMPTPPFLQLLGHCCCQTMTSWGETSMRSRWSFTGLSSRSVAGSWC